ncbi:MAG: ATPase [Treponema sp.]|jgi:hypothetical protein|nr:ATPase [Treponema sp.]
MEELQSSEALDREILEDARRKAQRLLKAADETIAAGEQTWAQKLQTAVAGLKQRYAEGLEQNRLEIMARLPLDKRRSRLEKIDALLRAAAAAYLAGLEREGLLGLLRTEAGKRLAELEGAGGGPGEFTLGFQRLTPEEAERLGALCLGNGPWAVSPEGPCPPSGDFPALVLESPAARISVSVEGTVESLLQDKRAELAAALLGEEVLDA